MKINCHKVFMIGYVGVMIVSQILTIVGILKDDKDTIVTGASLGMVDTVLLLGKLIGEGVYDQPNREHGEMMIVGDADIEMS